MRQLLSQATFKPELAPKEQVGEISLTIPDQSFTPQEILLRFSRGQKVNVLDNLQHTGPDALIAGVPIPDLRTLDLVDREEILQWAKREVIENQKKIDAKIKAKQAVTQQYNERLQQLLEAAKTPPKKEE